MIGTTPDVSVVICAVSEARYDCLIAAVASVQRQSVPAREIIMVIDHNPPLLERALRQFPEVCVMENHEAPGLGGARNSGLAAAQGAVVAFLDDDAVATPVWLEQLSAGYEDPDIVGVGGAIEPLGWRAAPLGSLRNSTGSWAAAIAVCLTRQPRYEICLAATCPSGAPFSTRKLALSDSDMAVMKPSFAFACASNGPTRFCCIGRRRRYITWCNEPRSTSAISAHAATLRGARRRSFRGCAEQVTPLMRSAVHHCGRCPLESSGASQTLRAPRATVPAWRGRRHYGGPDHDNSGISVGPDCCRGRGT